MYCNSYRTRLKTDHMSVVLLSPHAQSRLYTNQRQRGAGADPWFPLISNTLRREPNTLAAALCNNSLLHQTHSGGNAFGLLQVLWTIILPEIS